MTLSTHFSKPFNLGALLGGLATLGVYGYLIYLFQHTVCHSILSSAPAVIGEILIGLTAIAGTVISGVIGGCLGGLLGMSIQCCKDCCCDEGYPPQRRTRDLFYDDSESSSDDEPILSLPHEIHSVNPSSKGSPLVLVTNPSTHYLSFNHDGSTPSSPNEERINQQRDLCYIL